jgi:hypothetical protein
MRFPAKNGVFKRLETGKFRLSRHSVAEHDKVSRQGVHHTFMVETIQAPKDDLKGTNSTSAVGESHMLAGP